MRPSYKIASECVTLTKYIKAFKRCNCFFGNLVQIMRQIGREASGVTFLPDPLGKVPFGHFLKKVPPFAMAEDCQFYSWLSSRHIFLMVS